MPNVNDISEGKFLKQGDVEPPIKVTIEGYEKANVALESQEPEMKWTLIFEELKKHLVLNKTNGQLIAAITGSGDFDNWIGKIVVLYNDKTVSYAGKITGGIRVRAAKDIPEYSSQESTPTVYDENAPSGDDIPFDGSGPTPANDESLSF